MSGDASLLIPRVFHRIWLGNQPMPEGFERFGETWRAHHPGWEMRLWTEDNLPPSRLLGQLNDSGRHVSRSILLRLEVLRQFGGVYIDTDMECLRSIEPLLGGVRAFAGYQSPKKVCGAVVGGVPGHPVFERGVRDHATRMRVGKGKMPGYSRSFFSSLMIGFPGVTLFEPEVFYPYLRHDFPRPGSDFPLAYAVHHWSWLGRGEPTSLQEQIAFLEKRAAAARRGKSRFRRKTEKAERRLVKMERGSHKTDHRVRKLEARVAELEASRWWRIHPARLLGQRNSNSSDRQ
jgi:hypothetical protein